jgi:hypothetical protein
MLAELLGTLAEGSGNVSWTIYTGKTAEEALAATSFLTGTWKAGRNLTTRPRARGDSLVLKLTGTADSTWAVEEMQITAMPKGRLR